MLKRVDEWIQKDHPLAITTSQRLSLNKHFLMLLTDTTDTTRSRTLPLVKLSRSVCFKTAKSVADCNATQDPYKRFRP